MKHWILPVTGVAVVAVAAVGLTSVPLVQPPAKPVPVPDARVSVLCPASSNQDIVQRLAAVAVDSPVRVSPLGGAEGEDQPDRPAVVDIKEPTRVSASRNDAFGATTWLAVNGGSDRGLSVVGCVPAATSWWFTGVELTSNTQAEIVLANLDAVDVLADVTIWTKDGLGRAMGLSGIKVLAGRTTVVPLNIRLMNEAPVAVRVATSSGRVVAHLRQQLWAGSQSRGADWVPAGSAPARDLVIPGIPPGDGRRLLVIANPGLRSTVVSVTLLGENGRAVPPGLDAIEVPAESAVTVDVEAALADQAGALELAAAAEVTAGVLIDAGGDANQVDPAFLAASAPLGADGIWPFASGPDMSLDLQLTNPGVEPVRASVTTGSGADENLVEVEIPPESSLRTQLPSLSPIAVRVQTSSTGLYGAIIATGKVDAVTGLAVVGLSGTPARPSEPIVHYDPHAGA